MPSELPSVIVLSLFYGLVPALSIWYALLPWFILRTAKKMLKAQEETNALLRQQLARAHPTQSRPVAPPIPHSR